jgi:hypothetical protein
VRGPVGSLEAPSSPSDHEVLEADGVQVYLHRDVLAAAADPARIGFDLGPRGRCWLVLEPSPP